MTSPLALHFFSDELLRPEIIKEAVTVGDIQRLAGAAGKAIRSSGAMGQGLMDEVKHFGPAFLEHASAPLKALHPTGKYIRQGWGELSNLSDASRKAMREAIESGSQQGHRYVDTTAQGTGLLDRARASGWLYNTPQYVGPETRRRAGATGEEAYSYVRATQNRLARALPGKKTMFVLPAAADAAYTAAHDEDPNTGRRLGMGERIGRIGLGTGANLVGVGMTGTKGFAGQLAGGLVGETLGAHAGATLGRKVDELRQRRALAAGAGSPK